MKTMQLLQTLWKDQDGQDMVEYTLLVAFIVFVTAGFVGFGTDSIKGIVNTSTSQIAAANSVIPH
jgi:Flp pilus assembly pilin Flp